MESLIKQTRARILGLGKDDREDSSCARDGKTPSQKPQTIRDKKRSEGWIRRQFSRPTKEDRDFGGDDYPAAVAAVALAIQSLEESRARDQKSKSHVPNQSLKKTKSKPEDKRNLPKPSKGSAKLSDETSKTSSNEKDKLVPISTSLSRKTSAKAVASAPSMKKKPTISYTDANNIIIDKPEKASPKKATEPALSMGRNHLPSADKEVNITGSETPESTAGIPDCLATLQSASPVETNKQIPPKPRPGDAKADAWEKAEMAKIKERYEKLNATIQNWETKKNKKAKRKLESIEAQLDMRKAKAIRKCLREMERIEEIALRATTQAKQNQRNEELEVAEKANKFRSTGKLPATCMCF